MERVLAVSPHLDDAVFSCGGTLARLAAGGAAVTMATVFTRTAPGRAGAGGIDVMAVRRAEDRTAAARLGADRAVHLDFPDAPHRGYGGPGALLRPRLRADRIVADVADDLLELIAGLRPDLLLVPQGVGGHSTTCWSSTRCCGRWPTWAARAGRSRARWPGGPTPPPPSRPACARSRAGRPVPPSTRTRRPGSPRGFPEVAVPLDGALARKLAAAAAYATRLDPTFGGEHGMRAVLGAFAAAEGARFRLDGPAEVLRAPSGAPLPR